MAPLVVALGRLDVALHLHRVACDANHGRHCKGESVVKCVLNEVGCDELVSGPLYNNLQTA